MAAELAPLKQSSPTSRIRHGATVTPEGGGTYAFAPFPFAGEAVEISCSGRYLTPYKPGQAPDNLAAALAALPPAEQTYRFVRG